MAIVSKLVGIWLAGRTMNSAPPVLTQLLSAVAAIAVLAAFGAALLAILFAGLLWLFYNILLTQGFMPNMAFLYILCVIVLALSVVAYFAQHYIRQIRILAQRATNNHSSGKGGIGSIANAFVEGLRQRTRLDGQP